MSPEEAAARARAWRSEDEADVRSAPPVKNAPELKEEKKPSLKPLDPTAPSPFGMPSGSHGVRDSSSGTSGERAPRAPTENALFKHASGSHATGSRSNEAVRAVRTVQENKETAEKEFEANQKRMSNALDAYDKATAQSTPSSPAPTRPVPTAPTPIPPLSSPADAAQAKAFIASEYVTRGDLPIIINAAINSFLQAISAATGSASPEVLGMVDGSLLWRQGVPDTTGYTKYMVYQITDDTTYPPTAGWDWVRAHG